MPTLPWKRAELVDWSICGMNHYFIRGEKYLLVSMVNTGVCISVEGKDDEVLWERLVHAASNNHIVPKKLTHDSVYNIQRVIVEYFQISFDDLKSKRRSRSIALPRQMAMSLARELTPFSLPEIGDMFGGRDHSTVYCALKRIEQLRADRQDIDADYLFLKNRLVKLGIGNSSKDNGSTSNVCKT